ncbi:MAG: hypothetical protein ACE5JI_11375 [Acidobacteriota bacterium]
MSRTWGTRPQERSLPFPCDRFVQHFHAEYYRAITIRARPETIFRWLCQMRVAPYSYDWIDNLGRRSPQRLTPGMDELAFGQTFMYGFELIDFELNRQLTIRSKPGLFIARIFGDILVSYLIFPHALTDCRLLVKLIVRHVRGPTGWLMRVFLPWGDLIMMRRQLLNFKMLAERRQNGV